jgi:phosphatidyl-myo-inositol dimannoside synthase
VADLRRAIVIGPQFAGDDGVSELGRQVIQALAIDPATHVLVRSLHDRTSPALHGVPYEFTSALSSRTRLGSMIVGDAARVSGPDLVVVLHSHFLPVALPLIVRGASLTAILIGIEVWRPLTRLERVALSRASQIVAISSHTRERFLEANPSATNHPIVVCHPAVPHQGEMAARVVAPGFALMVGRMSRGERYKGHDTALDAWSRVLSSHPDARLVVAGEGDDGQRLQEKAQALGLSASVTFLGHVDRAQLGRLYADAAFFVMPSRDEGFGFVYLEAMRAGKPCVACDGAAAELLEHQQTGELVRFDHVEDLAAACTRLFADREACARMGRAAAGTVQQRFLMGHFVERFRSALTLTDPPSGSSAPKVCA